MLWPSCCLAYVATEFRPIVRACGTAPSDFSARGVVKAKMWNTLFAIAFYAATRLALVAAAIWYGLSLYDALPGHGQIVIASFDIVGNADTDKSRGTALANMLQARLGKIERDLETAQQRLVGPSEEAKGAQSPTDTTETVDKTRPRDAKLGYVAGLPSLWETKAIDLKTALFEPANINATVGGVEVGGIVAWLQRSLVNPRTLKFTAYENKGVAQISGSLKPLGISDDALRLDIPAQEKDAQTVPLDRIVDRLALEIMRRWMARDPQNRIEVLKTDEFGAFLDILKTAARCNRFVALGRPAHNEFKDLVVKVEPLARAVPDWYQLNYLAASIAESADNPDLRTENLFRKAIRYYRRVAKVLSTGDKQLTDEEKKKREKVLAEVQAKIRKLNPRLLDIVTEKVNEDVRFSVDYFNELFKVDLAGPSLLLRDEENVEGFPLAFSDGNVCRASPGVQHIPDVTYHNVAFQYLKNVVD
jgi:hypothetical protein